MSVIENSIEVYKNMAKARTQDCINYKKELERYKNIVEEAIKYLYECKKTIENDKDYEIDDYLVSASILLEILKGE